MNIPVEEVIEKTKGYALKSPELESLLQAGYPDMTAERAQQILDESKKDSKAYPLELQDKAKAFWSAYTTKPKAIDTEPAWRRIEG